jgi:hypothetical protein
MNALPRHPIAHGPRHRRAAPQRAGWRACRRLAATLGLVGGVGASAGAVAADCVSTRGGDIVLNASDSCREQIRRDPVVRRSVVRTIDQQIGGISVAAAPVTASTGSAASARSGHPAAGLTHPLARLSLLNAQSRYLWSLGNPAPTYYGQTAP